MAAQDPLTKPVDINELLLTKHLEPVAPQHLATLQKVAVLDVSTFSEMEVRSYVIDPIVAVLGYEKGTVFSPTLEHRVTFLGKHIFPDYQFALWNENFWLIEAKKPRIGKDHFEADDLRQGIEYSVHPTINASLVVLCDGLKLEIFDREASVEAPLVYVAIKDIVAEIDKIRALLDPMQVWFFQKRRVARLIDKVFDKEFNMERVEEFSRLVDGRLRSKHQQILENFRKAPKPGENADLEYVKTAPAIDLIEMFFFFESRIPVTNAVNHRLVELSKHNTFHVTNRMFPEGRRDVSDVYMAKALAYFMRLGEGRGEAQMLPSWLAKNCADHRNVEQATSYLLRQCLTYFEGEEDYKIILLAANAIRRIAKIMVIGIEAVRAVGEARHAVARYHLPEMSWAQFLASPEKELIGLMDARTVMATMDFVRRHQGDNYSFKTESARQALRSLWRTERAMLASLGDYAKLSKERSLGEMRMTEWSSVTYDYLGHLTLCFVEHYPKWRDFILKNYPAEIHSLAALGSWSARKLLSIPDHATVKPLDDEDIARRFFFGDADMLQALRRLYKGERSAQGPSWPR